MFMDSDYALFCFAFLLIHVVYHVIFYSVVFDNSWTFFQTSFNALQEWGLIVNSSMTIPNQPFLLQTKFTYEQMTG